MPKKMKLGLGLVVSLLIIIPVHAQWTTLDWKMHNVGKVRQLITNMGTLDDSHDRVRTAYPGLIFCEMPAGSNEEHIYQAGIWIAAIDPNGDTLVSVSRTHFTPHEMFPSAEPWDTVWVATKNDTLDIPYWPKYTAIADQDFICRYGDYHILNIENHKPLFIDVIQRSYAWSAPPLDEFIVLNYDVLPLKFNLKNVFIGFWLHGKIGNNDVADNFIDEFTYFFPENRLIVGEDAKDGNDGTAISPIGIKILDPIDSTLTWTYKWYNHEDMSGHGRDAVLFRQTMATGEIMQNRQDAERVHVTVCFGPYPEISVGDTLHFEIGEVFGYGMAATMENAKYLDFLRDRDYKVPFPPPKPPLRVTIRSHEVHLNWRAQPGDINPETYKDPYRGDNSPQPFEGYRVYKSTVSAQGPWTLIAAFDVPANDFESNIGLDYDYTDIGLLNNFEYFYTVTAFSKPDKPTNFPSQESSKNANAQVVVPGTPSPETVGEVAVVPNPYRGDEAYHQYNPQWEKPTGSRQLWMEQDRRIQFINLPSECEIKIYTLAGDLITTISHLGNHAAKQGYEDWNLTSSVGQAIASGIYFFTVEDPQTGEVQVGKFVIIK